MHENCREAVQKFDALRERCREMGLFRRSLAPVLTELAFVLVAWTAALYLRGDYPLAAFTLATIAGITLVWWIHDSGHDALFESRRVSQLLIETLGILFLGMPQIEYHYEVHRLHHAHANIIGKDGALQTGPVRWHFKQLRSAQDGFNPHQSLIWFGFALPFVWPLISIRCVQTLRKQKKFLRLALLALRWIAVLVIFRHDLAFVFGPPLISGFVMGFVGSLNHFHMPMDDKRLDAFPKNIFLTTQNLSNRGFLATWVTGGLNYHIEHHLFPTMPSRNLRYAAPLVEAFAAEQGYPYQICSAPEAVRKLHHRLQNPITAPAETLGVPV